jgi:hypothetical protein
VKIPATTAARANLNHWKAGQGARIKAARRIEIYRACEYIAVLCAAVRDPLELTKDEMILAMRRAVSAERRKLHGPLPRTGDEWWEQINAIAEQWGIKTTRDQWTSSTKGDERKAA